MADFNYAGARFKIRAEIGSTEFRDIVQFTGTFELNSIPTAVLWVAVGRDVQSDKLASAHEFVKSLDRQLPVKVFLEVIPGEEQGVDLGLKGMDVEGGVLIFEGDIVGIGYQRSPNSVVVTLYLLHWLAHLHHGSAVSASSHPGNPGDWTYPTTYRAIGLGTSTPETGLKSGPPAWVPMIALPSVTAGQVQTDLWGEVLHRYLSHLASDDPIDARLLGGQPGGADERTLDAVRRIGPGNPDYVPLSLDLAGADSEIISKNIWQAIQMEVGSEWINTTMWGKLVGDWSPAYWLAVVPRVTDALIIPFCPGLRDTYKVLKAETWSTSNLHGELHQSLRAVGIVHPLGSLTGVDLSIAGVPADRSGLAALYNPPGIDKGLVLLKDAPRWLVDPVLPFDYSLVSTGADGREINTAFDEENVGAARQPNHDIVGAAQNGHPAILQKFAHAWYVIEVLKGRTGEVSGRLRFDISPGSQIKLETARGVNIPGDDSLSVDLYAMVNRVTVSIDAEHARAGTSFTLAHLRNNPENKADWSSTTRPPLYTKKWVGSPLVQEAR